MTKLRYAFEALFLSLLLGIFRILPAQTASNFGGSLGRSIGPRLAASRKARRNIERALPDLSEQEKDSAITGMWEHLGRVIAEYPHLAKLGRDNTEIIGAENLENAIKSEHGAIFFGGHLGNWEINSAAVLMQHNNAIDISYRAPNNPWSDKLLMNARSIGGQITAHAKSSQGGKGMMGAVKKGGGLGILIDQKYNQGLSMPFFGHDAMTNPFFVQLAQKYKCSLVPIRNRRLENHGDGANFSLTIYEPVAVFEKDGTPRPVEDVIKDSHALLEGWIRETPEQWLWLHRRWSDGPKDKNDD